MKLQQIRELAELDDESFHHQAKSIVLSLVKEVEGLRKERLNIQDLRKHIRELRVMLDKKSSPE